ncbi:MAG TPA: hypothetical protein VFA12_20175 [Stellaceae bacterium]|nr:hypothetical protein [Stellaceae bacterium]
MADPIPFKRPVNWARLRADQAEAIVRERAKTEVNVIFGDHAFDRIDDRSILAEDAYWILQTGFVEGQPEYVGEGEWKVIMVRRMPGCREAGVVTIIVSSNDEVFVKTVEWMDWLR